MELPAAITLLNSLRTCSPDDAFGSKAGELECALNCFLGASGIPTSAKSSLQFFLSRLESNQAAFAKHKPVVDVVNN